MALKDKLGDLSKQIAAEKQAEAKTKENEELKPIRARIKQLEKEKLDLEMINNSLDFKQHNSEGNSKSDEYIQTNSGLKIKKYSKRGLGMQENADSIAFEKKKARAQLESEAATNPAAIDKLGIKNLEGVADELAAHPDLSEEEEVVAYKQALSQQEDLALSDTKLKNRLTKLGLEMRDEDFSYEAASQEIGKRLEGLNSELISENLKTPEGREKAVDGLAEEFSKNTKHLAWVGSSMIDKNAQRSSGYEANDNSYYDFEFPDKPGYRGDNLRVEFINNDKSKISNYHRLPILPDNFNEEVDKYGLEIAEEALKKSYAKKTEEAFMAPNAPLRRTIRLQVAMESISPEQGIEAIAKMDEAVKKLNEVPVILQKKSEQLSKKGIEFNPKFNNYGSYADIICLRHNLETAGYIAGKINDNNNFPPRYDSIKVQEGAKKLTSLVDEFIGVINNLESQEDVDKFLSFEKSWGTVYKKEEDKSIVESFHERFINGRLSTSTKYDLEPGNDISPLMRKFKSYHEAAKYADKEIAEQEAIKKTVSDKIAELVEYKIAENNIRNSDKEHNNRSLDSIRDIIKKVESDRSDAKKLMLALTELQARLPQEEELRVKGISVDVPSKRVEYVSLNQEIEKKQKELQEAKSKLSEKQNSEPWLGKDAWRKKVEELQAEVNKIDADILELKRKYNLAVENSSHYLKVKDGELDFWGDTKKAVEAYSASGKADEVFEGLKKKLMELVDKEPLTDLKNQFDKLDDLAARLSGKK